MYSDRQEGRVCGWETVGGRSGFRRSLLIEDAEEV